MVNIDFTEFPVGMPYFDSVVVFLEKAHVNIF